VADFRRLDVFGGQQLFDDRVELLSVLFLFGK
jgi:hypothetical protein